MIVCRGFKTLIAFRGRKSEISSDARYLVVCRGSAVVHATVLPTALPPKCTMASMSLPAPDRDACSYSACLRPGVLRQHIHSRTPSYLNKGLHNSGSRDTSFPGFGTKNCSGITHQIGLHPPFYLLTPMKNQCYKDYTLETKKENIIMDNLIEKLKGKIFQSSKDGGHFCRGYCRQCLIKRCKCIRTQQNCNCVNMCN